MKQLILPGLEAPAPLILFLSKICNSDYCFEPAKYLALYLDMGMYNEDDDRPELVGYDCPLESSLAVYGCDAPHLERQIQDNYHGHGLIEAERIPDIIVNALGSIEIDLYDRILGRLDETLEPDFLTAKLYSQNRESLEELWKRESWRWI